MATVKAHANAAKTRSGIFNEAVEKCLGLIDVGVTPENFQSAFPSLKPDMLKEVGENFISELKRAIKEEKDKLVEHFGLEERLAELDRLVKDAKANRSDEDIFTDVWRANIDISTAIYSRSIPFQQETVRNLEKELQEIEAENKALSSQLDQYMESEETLRIEAIASLQRLDETIAGLETSPEVAVKVHDIVDLLLERLGPRGTSTRPP